MADCWRRLFVVIVVGGVGGDDCWRKWLSGGVGAKVNPIKWNYRGEKK